MKKYLFMLLWTACAVACSDSDPAPQPDDEGPTPPPDKEQQVVCGIEKPEEGASVNLAEKPTCLSRSNTRFLPSKPKAN